MPKHPQSYEEMLTAETERKGNRLYKAESSEFVDGQITKLVSTAAEELARIADRKLQKTDPKLARAVTAPLPQPRAESVDESERIRRMALTPDGLDRPEYAIVKQMAEQREKEAEIGRNFLNRWHK